MLEGVDGEELFASCSPHGNPAAPRDKPLLLEHAVDMAHPGGLFRVVIKGSMGTHSRIETEPDGVLPHAAEALQTDGRWEHLTKEDRSNSIFGNHGALPFAAGLYCGVHIDPIAIFSLLEFFGLKTGHSRRF